MQGARWANGFTLTKSELSKCEVCARVYIGRQSWILTLRHFLRFPAREPSSNQLIGRLGPISQPVKKKLPFALLLGSSTGGTLSSGNLPAAK